MTIALKDVLAIINERSPSHLTTKAMILDGLELEHTAQNKRLLTKVIQEMKRQNMIYTCFGCDDDTYLLAGRGYVAI